MAYLGGENAQFGERVVEARDVRVGEWRGSENICGALGKLTKGRTHEYKDSIGILLPAFPPSQSSF